MSGGSWGYYFATGAGQLLEHASTLESMAHRLDRSGYKDAALLNANTAAAIRTCVNEMKEIWRTVEWVDSCDYSEDQLKQEIEKWRKEARK